MKVGMNVSQLLGISLVLSLLAAGTAHAYTYPTYGRYVIVGRTVHAGSNAMWLCSTDGTSGSDAWTPVGGASLTYDTVINSYYTGGSQRNIVVETTTESVTFGSSGCSATWHALSYGTREVTVNAIGSTPAAIEGGYGPTYLFGTSGDDIIVSYSLSSYYGAQGNDGDDRLFDLSGASLDLLYGNDGSDCLEDYDGSAYVFDCGGGAPDYWVNNGVYNYGSHCTATVAHCI